MRLSKFGFRSSDTDGRRQMHQPWPRGHRTQRDRRRIGVGCHRVERREHRAAQLRGLRLRAAQITTNLRHGRPYLPAAIAFASANASEPSTGLVYARSGTASLDGPSSGLGVTAV